MTRKLWVKFTSLDSGPDMQDKGTEKFPCFPCFFLHITVFLRTETHGVLCWVIGFSSIFYFGFFGCAARFLTVHVQVHSTSHLGGVAVPFGTLKSPSNMHVSFREGTHKHRMKGENHLDDIEGTRVCTLKNSVHDHSVHNHLSKKKGATKPVNMKPGHTKISVYYILLAKAFMSRTFVQNFMCICGDKLQSTPPFNHLTDKYTGPLAAKFLVKVIVYGMADLWHCKCSFI